MGFDLDFLNEHETEPDIPKIIDHLNMIYNLSILFDFESAYEVFKKIKPDLKILEDKYFLPTYVFKENCKWLFIEHYLNECNRITGKCEFGYYALFQNSFDRIKVWKDDEGFAYVYNEYNNLNRFQKTYLVELSEDFGSFCNYKPILFDNLIEKHRSIFIFHYSKESAYYSDKDRLKLAICLRLSFENVILRQNEIEKQHVALIIPKQKLHDQSIKWAQFLKGLKSTILDIGKELSLETTRWKFLSFELHQDVNGFNNLVRSLTAEEIFGIVTVCNQYDFEDVAVSVLERHFNEANNTDVLDELIKELLHAFKCNDETKKKYLIYTVENLIKSNEYRGFQNFGQTCGCGESPCVCYNNQYC